MKLTPLYPYILITPDPIEEKTSSGLILPDYSKTPKNTGVIKHIGEEASQETDLKAGDRVLWKPIAPSAIEVDEDLLLEIGDLLCKLPEK